MSSSQEANQPGSCFSVSENNVISNLPEKMDFHDGKVVDGVFHGHGGSRAAGNVQQKVLLLEHPLFSSNPNVAIVTSGAPRPAFGLNEHQGGIFVDGTALSIAFQESDARVMVGFDGKWVTWAIVKTSGHGDSPAADYAWKQVRSTVLRFLGAMSFFQKIFLALGVLCNLLQPANAQQVTGSSDPADPAAWLRSDTAKVAFVTALFAGGVGAAFIWKRFFRRPLTFSVDAGLEASPAELGRRRSGLDSVCPRIDEC